MDKKRILIFFMAIVVAGVVFGIYQFNKPHKDYVDAKVEVSTTAESLYDAFNSDEGAANAAYLSKVVEVSGTPTFFATNPNGSVTISLFDDMMGVSCTFDSTYVADNQAMFQEVKTMDAVSIKGRCDGYLTDVRLSKCSFTAN